MDVHEALEMGKRAHINGDLLTARAHYRLVLERQAGHVEARHLTAVLDLQEGRARRAADLLQEVVAEAPEVFKYRLNLALALVASGDGEAASVELNRLLTVQPDHPQVLGNLARLAFDAGRFDEAERYFTRAAELVPHVPEFPMNAGVCRARLGDMDGARTMLMRAFSLGPTSRDVTQNLERVYGGLTVDERLSFWSDAVRRHPASAGAHMALGNVLVQQGQVEQGLLHYQRATLLDERWTDAFVSAGRAYHALQRVPEARVMANRAALLDDESMAALTLLARVATEQRDGRSADWAMKRMLEIDPDDLSALSARANQLASQGDMDGVVALFTGRELTPGLQSVYDLAIATAYDKTDVDKARAVLRPIMDREPENIGAVRLFASLANTSELRREAVNLLLTRPDVPGHEGAYRHFEVARLLDKLGDYEDAWDHVVEANGRHNNPYVHQTEQRLIERVRSVFDGSVDAIRLNQDELRPVFIVGMPRSGTTLTETILDRHSHFQGVGESAGSARGIVESQSAFAGEIHWPELFHDADADVLNRFRNGYLRALDSEVERIAGLRPVDKMPGNYRRVGVLAAAFPNARFVWCRRDWRDNLISLYFGYFGGHHPYAYDLDDIRHEYAMHNAYMAHWQRFGVEVYEHSYTRVIEDFEGAVRDLLAFVGVDFEPEVLDFHRAQRVVNTMSFRQVRQPLYRSSLDRWKRYERHLLEHFGPTTIEEEPSL